MCVRETQQTRGGEHGQWVFKRLVSNLWLAKDDNSTGTFESKLEKNMTYRSAELHYKFYNHLI